MNRAKTLLTFVLDESGSMATVQDRTISGFNEFLDSQRDRNLGECRVTLVKFNCDQMGEPQVRTVYKDKHIDDVKGLDKRLYKPTGGTPLYDAIAQAIHDTEDKYKEEKEVLSKLLGKVSDAATPLCIMVVTTDGQENASKQYNQPKIADMINAKKKEGWTFVYLGANQDSWAVAAPLGFGAGNIANYAQARVHRAFGATGQSLVGVRSCYASNIATMDMVANATNEEEKAKFTATLQKQAEELAAKRSNYWAGQKDVS